MGLRGTGRGRRRPYRCRVCCARRRRRCCIDRIAQTVAVDVSIAGVARAIAIDVAVANVGDCVSVGITVPAGAIAGMAAKAAATLAASAVARSLNEVDMSGVSHDQNRGRCLGQI